MNCAFSTQNPEKVSTAYIQQIQKELGTSTGINYTIQNTDMEKTNVFSFFKDVGSGLFGTGKSVILFTIGVDLSQPRPCQIHIPIIRQGVGAHGSALFYQAPIKSSVVGEVYLEDPKTSKHPKFVGNNEVAAQLNIHKDILEQANSFARTVGEIGGFKLTAPRFFKITSGEKGGQILASTFPVMKMMGFKCSLEMKEFMELVQKIEKALQ